MSIRIFYALTLLMGITFYLSILSEAEATMHGGTEGTPGGAGSMMGLGMMGEGLTTPSMDPARGRIFFASKGCVACHAVNGVGGEDAPPLDATTMQPLMNPAAEFRAVSTIEVDLVPTELGQRITAVWRGAPIFIDHRTPGRIALARADDNNPRLVDPATDASRVKREEWLIVVGVCTHLGCIPLGQKPADPLGEWDGWFCSCHGSHYDTSGRIRKGPAPRNLDLPPYEFVENGMVRIG